MTEVKQVNIYKLMIQIKRNNKVFFTLEDFGEGSKLSYQLMDHHYIILKFTTANPIYFEIGDSVEIPDFGCFELTSSYFPKHNDSDGYDYEMQMDAYYMSWKNKICKYRPQHGANETSFNLTTTVGVHMNVILGNLKALGLTYNGKDFSVDYTMYNNKAFDVQKRFLIEYGSISILDALNAICSEDALNCEWWIDGSIIYLGYCEMEGQTTFEQDVNVLSMSYSESKSTYITRLYAFGSDRNIPKGYFTGADADVTTDGVATDYLMLPNKEVDSDGFYAKDGYLENVNVVKNDKQAIEGVVMFEEEYPKVESVVSSIKTYDSTVDNEDGTKTTQTFWQVTSTDSFTNSFKESWIKSNLTLGIKFTSGALMGMEFDVSFKVIDKVNYFEIVANDTYGRTLPDGVMCPKVGDKYFLFNWDATKITDTDLIPAAQLSLFDRAKQYYQKTMISNSNFTCTMDGDKFYNDGTYDYHPLGEQVKLINDMFAQVDADGKHYRNSRIIGMEIPLDIPYDHPQYIVGEKAATSRLGKLEDKVDSITVNGIQISGGNGGGGVYVIGMNDSTPPTDSNVLSARKTILSFLSKLHDDTAQGVITFVKGLVSEALVKLNRGAYFGKGGALIDEAGRAILESLQSIDYDNEAEQGFAVKKENGKYHAFVTNLTIWGNAIFNQLDVRKLSYAGGNVYLSGSGSKIVKVVPVTWESESSEWIEASVEMCEGWLCYLLADDGTTATENLWREGDQVRCKTIGTLATGTMNASNKSYWRTIPTNGISQENEKIYDGFGNELYGGQMFSWIVLGKHSVVFDGGDESSASPEIAGIPEAGDTIVLDGSRNDTTRQGVLILESTGENTPRIVGFKGVNRYTHENKEVFVLSPDRISLNSGIFEWVSPSGDAMHMVNYRGEWKAGSYDYYDQVNHNNALWTCINENGTSQEPSDASSDWQKVLSGEKGEKGEKGDRGDEGPQGPKGETGTQGETGAQGPQGEKGEQGTPGVNGNDGITWLLTPDTLMYDTDDNGKAINVGTGKTTTLRVLRGDEELTDVTIVGVKNMVNCVASRLNETNSFYISAIAVQKAALGTDTIDVSCTNGSFDIDFSVDGVTYTATAKFAVNVSAFTGRMTLNNRQFKTEITSLQRTMQSGLEILDSKITQTAEDITLSVSKKKAGRRNLLYGTAFNRDGLIDCNPHFQPTITEGMNGMNAVRFSVTASDSFQYHGLFWRGEYGNIPVKRNTDYTFSCWVKSDNPHAMLYTERYSKSDATTSERGTAIPLSKGDVWWRNDGNWQLVTNTFNSGNTDFVEITIFLFNGDENSEPTLNAQAWFCMPMLEEGLEYTGWTLSERDSDYVGGNMLDDTRTLVASSQQSNLLLAKDVTADAYEGAYAVAHGKADESNNNACDVLRFTGEGGRNLDLGQGKNYVFSFLARGNGTLVAYMYKDSVHASIYSENSQGYVLQSVPDGRLNFTLTSQWKRYWIHWRIDPYTGDGDTVLPKSVLLRAVDGCEVWITKPKLEEGAQVTEYTEKKTDLIDKSTAKAAGLEITADGVELYGDKVMVKNNGKTAAMFTDGKLNADLIDADTINVHHVWAKDGNNQNTLAHFGNYGIIEAKDEEGRSCPLWVGSSTASSSPFRVSKDGYMYAEKGAFGIRYYEDEESGEQRAYGRFEITQNGIETGELFKEDSMSLTDTSFYLIKKIGDNKTSEAVFLDSHGDTLPTPGLGVYLNAKVRVDATGILSEERRSNVCYYANAKNGLQNYAMYGSGDISLDGSVYAYKATMVNLKTKNVFLDNTGSIKATTYNEPQMIDSLTLLVSSQNELALTLPTLGTIEQMLFGSYAMKGKFYVRLTIVMDIGCALVHIRGRSVVKDQAGVAQWNYADFPLMFNWDGGYAPGLKMSAGNSCEILLTYDPDKKYKTDIFEQPYIARIINLQY